MRESCVAGTSHNPTVGKWLIIFQSSAECWIKGCMANLYAWNLATLTVSPLLKNIVRLEWARLWCSQLNVMFVLLLNHGNVIIIHWRKVIVPVSRDWVWGLRLWHLSGGRECHRSQVSVLTANKPGTTKFQLFRFAWVWLQDEALSGMEGELLYAVNLLRWRDLSARKPKVCTSVSFGSWIYLGGLWI